jgi:hypothetical protein
MMPMPIESQHLVQIDFLNLDVNSSQSKLKIPSYLEISIDEMLKLDKQERIFPSLPIVNDHQSVNSSELLVSQTDFFQIVDNLLLENPIEQKSTFEVTEIEFEAEDRRKNADYPFAIGVFGAVMGSSALEMAFQEHSKLAELGYDKTAIGAIALASTIGAITYAASNYSDTNFSRNIHRASEQVSTKASHYYENATSKVNSVKKLIKPQLTNLFSRNKDSSPSRQISGRTPIRVRSHE